MNRYFVNLPKPVEATDDDNLITGVKSVRWKNTKISDMETLETENWKAGDGLIFQNTIIENKTDTALSKMISFIFNELIEDKDNVIKIPLSTLEFSKNTEILGLNVIGVAGKKEGSIEMSFVLEEGGAMGAKIGDYLVIQITGALAKVLINKKVNMLIYYR